MVHSKSKKNSKNENRNAALKSDLQHFEFYKWYGIRKQKRIFLDVQLIRLIKGKYRIINDQIFIPQ